MASSRRLLLLGTGALLAVLVGLATAGLPGPARGTAATATMTAWCWLTGCLELPVASLLPALLLPATGAMSAGRVAPAYFHDILLLFLAGFILALALEHHELHRRFALAALAGFGTRPRRLVLGFMVVAASLSMFVSNTSTALLMLPVAMAVLEDCSPEARRALRLPLLLGVAYACSIGGTATPIGTPPNASLLGQFADRFPEAPTISFGSWVLGVLPFALCFLALCWLFLTRILGRLPTAPLFSAGELARRRSALGRMRPEQRRTLAVFALVALLWLTRSGFRVGAGGVPGWSALLPAAVADAVSDATVGLLGVVLLFLLPGSSTRGGALLDWEHCRRLPWGVLLLLGGGFALARAFEESGLSLVIGRALQGTVHELPLPAAVALTALVVTFLTELTSNTATINVLLPLFFGAAVAAEVHPLALALPATLAVSCAFMLPVATPPNAILFSSGMLSMGEMARAGLLLNLLTIPMVTLFTLCWLAPVLGLDLGSFPAWAH